MILLACVFVPLVSFAAPRTAPFTVGETLDPGAESVEPCGPTDANCFPAVLEVSDEGTTLHTSTNQIDFVGSGVSVASSTGGLITVTVPGDNVDWMSYLSASSTSYSTQVGFGAGENLNGSATFNTAVGYNALSSATSSSLHNTAIGAYALASSTSGEDNTAIGFSSLVSNTVGSNNTAIGIQALQGNTTGFDNVAIGIDSLQSNIDGAFNTAVGNFSLHQNNSNSNTAIGYGTLRDNLTGFSNTSIGLNSLGDDTTGSYNTAFGVNTLSDLNITVNDGSGSNTAFGYNTGRGIVTGINNTILGANVTGLDSNLSNNIIIADGSGNRRINVDATGNVGMGTTSPSAKLSISQGIGGSGNLFQIASSSDGVATTTHFVVDSFGNIGIGTAVPMAHVAYGSVKTLALAGTNPAFIIQNDADPLKEVGITNHITGVYFDSTGGATSSNNGMHFRVGSSDSSNAVSEALTILSTRNVGIGTSTPISRLSVTGAGTGTGRGFTVANSSNVDNFYVLDNGNTYMKGNVGIGTTSPTEKLVVSGGGNLKFDSTTATQKIISSRVGDVGLKLEFPDGGADNDDGISIGSSSGEHFKVSSRAVTFGNLVQNIYRVDALASANTLWSMSDTQHVIYGGMTGGGTNPNITLYSTAVANGTNANSIRFSTGSGDGFFSWKFHQSIDETPVTLDIRTAAGAKTDRISLMDGGAWLSSAVDDAVDSQTAWVLRSTNTLTQTNSKLLGVYNNTTEKFSIGQDGKGYFAGNVGIGTTTPDTKLSVLGQIKTSGSSGDGTNNNHGIVINNSAWGSNAGLWKIVSKNDVNGLAFYDNTAAVGDFSTNNIPLFLQHSTGNVGIGTTSPDSKLEIYGDASVLGLTHNATTSYTAIGATEQGVGIGTIEFIGSGFADDTRRGDLEIDAINFSGDVTLQASSGGNVGIGTSTPTAQLSTTGTVRFSNFGAGSLQTDANGNLSVSSDERLKDIEAPFTRGIEALRDIDPISYHWKQGSGFDTTELYTGFSAQNIQEFIPEAIGVDKHGFLTLSDRPLLATVINATKEQQIILDELILASSSVTSRISGDTFWPRLTALVGNFVDGVLTVVGIHSDEVQTKELCIGEVGDRTCITKERLDNLLRNEVDNSIVNSSDSSPDISNEGGTDTQESSDKVDIVIDTEDEVVVDPLVPEDVTGSEGAVDDSATDAPSIVEELPATPSAEESSETEQAPEPDNSAPSEPPVE